VDRRRSLDLILERSSRSFSEEERERLAHRKNGLFKTFISLLGPGDLLPGAVDALRAVRRAGVKVVLASASQNAPTVIGQLQIAGLFDAIADPVAAGRPKPAPDIFLAAAALVGADPARCIGVEDSRAGVTAIRAAGMTAIGIGDALTLSEADFVVPATRDLGISRFLSRDRSWSGAQS
jgi:alpha,alpha-trehalose phosphorylase